jgi:hypothetical protein
MGAGLSVRAVLHVACACVILWMGGGLWALKAAGLTGKAPDGSSAITQLIATLTSNWEWLIGTGVGLVLMLIAGIMLILIVIPAVLA